MGQSLLVALANYTCIKTSLDTDSYKLITTYAHEFSVWIILYPLIHDWAPHIFDYNGGLQTDISNLDLKMDNTLKTLKTTSSVFNKKLIYLAKHYLLPESLFST